MTQRVDSDDQGLKDLRGFIDSNPDPREQKRALALMMFIEGLPYPKIQNILNVSSSFISQSKARFAEHGIEGFKLGYKGSKGYLSIEERKEISKYLDSKDHLSLQELENYINEKYDVIFKSKQSYYDLLNKAGISWKKTQKKNPKKDDKLVAIKKKEIETILELNKQDIEAGKLVVYMIDECHLLWGDVCGYVWGKTNLRIEIPIVNERERQTYFGALNYLTKKFVVKEYETANSKNTVSFVKHLQELNVGVRILIIWDGASYHKYSEMRDYLAEVNDGLEKSVWQVTCELFAPHAPEQNPVEDIWLQGKKFLREYWSLCTSFKVVKILFNLAVNNQTFSFAKINMYGLFTKKLRLV